MIIDTLATITIPEERLSTHAVYVMCNFSRQAGRGEDCLVNVLGAVARPLAAIYTTNSVIEGQLGPLLGPRTFGIVLYVVNSDEPNPMAAGFRYMYVLSYDSDSDGDFTVGQVIADINSGDALRVAAELH
jgi:hypothetical protein